jgi:hypothetical protein
MFGSRVTAVHVCTQDSEALTPPLTFRYLAESTEDATQKSKGELDDKLRGLEHDVLVERGEVWDFLASVIQDREIDLAVIGTQGRTERKNSCLGLSLNKFFAKPIARPHDWPARSTQQEPRLGDGESGRLRQASGCARHEWRGLAC